MANRGAHAVAERLGHQAVIFPSHHGGFLGGEYGWAGEPERSRQAARGPEGCGLRHACELIPRPGSPSREEFQMQELLVDFITSLDGYGAAEGWPGFWGLQGPEYLAWLGENPNATTRS